MSKRYAVTLSSVDDDDNGHSVTWQLTENEYDSLQNIYREHFGEPGLEALTSPEGTRELETAMMRYGVTGDSL